MRQLLALAITLLVELPCAYFWRRGEIVEREEVFWRWPILIMAASLLTHPFAWWFNEGVLAHLPFTQRAILIEGAVIVLEMLFYWRATPTSLPRALGASFTANMTSFGVGLLLWYWGLL